MRRFVAVVLVLGVGCNAEQRADVKRLSIPDDEVVFTFGRLTDDTGVESLSRVTEATLSGSGRFLAIGDGAPPYVRMFDRDDGSSWSLGRDGDGPGELRNAWGMDFLGDSVLLVLAGQRVERFTRSGEWVGGVSMLEQGVRAMSITTGCSGRLFVYGVPDNHGEVDPVPWLYEFAERMDSAGVPRLTVPGRAAGSVRYGALFGLDGTDEGVFVWHRQVQSGAEAGYWIPCDGSEPELVEHTSTDLPIQEAFEVGAQMALRTVLPDTLFAGAVAQGSTMVRAVRWQDEDAPVTAVRPVMNGRCGSLELEGAWTLFDLQQDVMVVARSDPFPTVRGVRWGWVEENLTEVDCAS